MTVKTVFQGEAQLAGWNESHNNGRKATFWFADEDEFNKIKLLTARKGNVAGQRLAMVLVEINDDETPECAGQAPGSASAGSDTSTPATPDPAHRKGGPLARWTAMRCSEPEFQDWLWREHEALWDEARAVVEARGGPNSTDDIAAEIVRRVCEVESRADLDNDPEAEKRFHERIRVPFKDSQEQRA